MSKAGPSYLTWLDRRLDAAAKWKGESRAREYARVRASIVDFKARNLDDLGPVFYDGMLAKLDAAAKTPAPRPSPPVTEAGAFD